MHEITVMVANPKTSSLPIPVVSPGISELLWHCVRVHRLALVQCVGPLSQAMLRAPRGLCRACSRAGEAGGTLHDASGIGVAVAASTGPARCSEGGGPKSGGVRHTPTSPPGTGQHPNPSLGAGLQPPNSSSPGTCAGQCALRPGRWRMTELQLRGNRIELTNVGLMSLIGKPPTRALSPPSLPPSPPPPLSEGVSSKGSPDTVPDRAAATAAAIGLAFTSSSAHSVNGAAHCELPTSLPAGGLHTLDLAGLPLVSDTLLWYLAKHHSTSLEHLRLERCGMASRKGTLTAPLRPRPAAGLGERLQPPQRVSVSSLGSPSGLGVSEAGVLELLSAACGLRHLSLRHCCKVGCSGCIETGLLCAHCHVRWAGTVLCLFMYLFCCYPRYYR